MQDAIGWTAPRQRPIADQKQEDMRAMSAWVTPPRCVPNEGSQVAITCSMPMDANRTCRRRFVPTVRTLLCVRCCEGVIYTGAGWTATMGKVKSACHLTDANELMTTHSREGNLDAMRWVARGSSALSDVPAANGLLAAIEASAEGSTDGSRLRQGRWWPKR